MAATTEVSGSETPRLLLAVALGFVGMAIFAGTPTFTRLVVTEVDVWFVTFSRALVAAVPAAILLLITRRPLPPRRTWPWFAGIAFGATVAFPAFLGLAMTEVPSTHAGVVLAILPIATAMAATVVASERPSPRFWLLSALGGLVVGAFTLVDGGGSLGPGDLWLVGAAVSAGFTYALSGVLARSMPGWAVISWTLVFAAPAMAAMTALTFRPESLSVGAGPWLGFAYISLGSMFVGFFLWNRAMAMAGVARIGQLQLLAPFVTFAFGAAVLGERITAVTVAFAVVVVAIVFFAQRARVSRVD